MKIILIYLLLFTFYVDQVLGGVGISHLMIGLSLFNLNIYLLLLVWGLAIVQRHKILMPNNINKYLVMMCFMVLMSIFVKYFRAEIPDISFAREVISFKQWLNPLLLFFTLFNIIDDEKTCDYALMGLCILFLALIFTQLLATYGITSYQAQSMAKHGRAGAFGAAGEYAVTLALFFPFVLSGAIWGKKGNLFKIICMALVFFSLVGLVNAGSRNGAVTFSFGILIYFLILKRKKIVGPVSIILLVTVMLVAGITAFLVSPSGVKVRVTGRFDPTQARDLSEFTSGRTHLLKNGWRLFLESPLIGHGGKTFLKLSRLRGYTHSYAAHNEYIRLLAEYGIVGLILFLLIFYKIFQNIWLAIERTTNPWVMKISISYFAGLSAYMLGMFATNTGPSLNIFWIYTAIIYKYVELDKDTNSVSVKLKDSQAFPPDRNSNAIEYERRISDSRMGRSITDK